MTGIEAGSAGLEGACRAREGRLGAATKGRGGGRVPDRLGRWRRLPGPVLRAARVPTDAV